MQPAAIGIDEQTGASRVIPAGWELAKVKDIIELNYGKALKSDARAGGQVPVYGSNGLVGLHDRPLTGGPTIIVGRKGTVGAVHLSPQPCWPIDTTYYVDSFRSLDPQYLTLALRSLDLGQLDTSTAVPGLNRNDIYDQEILIPPLDEQRRIAAEVDRLVTAGEKCHQRLKQVGAILNRFRQSVLVAACSGRLTEGWRERLGETCRLDAGESTPIPKGWDNVTLGQVAGFVTSGPRGWAQHYSPTGAVFIRSQDINSDSLVLDKVARVTPPDSAERSRCQVRVGDLLVIITGANVTKAALVEVDIGEAYISQHVGLVRLVDPQLGRFLHLWLVSPNHGRAQLTEAAYGAGKPGLNLDNLKAVEVALPPITEQREIVRRVEALFKLADAIERRMEMASARTDALTQAILAKAFRGELVATEVELTTPDGRDYAAASVHLGTLQPKKGQKGDT